MQKHELKAHVIISGPIFPEPVQVMMTHDMGNLVKVIGKGLHTEKFYDPILDADQLDTITASPDPVTFGVDNHIGVMLAGVWLHHTAMGKNVKPSHPWITLGHA